MSRAKMKDQILLVLAESDAPIAMRRRLAKDTVRYAPRMKILPLLIEYDLGRISKEDCLTVLQSFPITEVRQDLRRYIDATNRSRVSAMPALLEELSEQAEDLALINSMKNEIQINAPWSSYEPR